MKTRFYFTEIVSSLLILLFCYTGITKLLDTDSLKFVLEELPVIKEMARPLSIIIPTIELAIAILLFIPRTRVWGLAGSFFLLLSFTLYILYMINYSPHLPCSCGGVISLMGWRAHLVFNICFALLALSALLMRIRSTFLLQ